MKIANKVNLSVLIILFLCVTVGGGVAYTSYRDIRGEMYRWFDASADHLAVKLSSEAKGYVSYFDFQALDEMMAAAAEDSDLLYLSIRHGNDLEDMTEIGDREAGPYKIYSSTGSEGGEVIVALDIHYGTRVIDEKLDAFVKKVSFGLAVTVAILVAFIYLFVSVVVNRPLMKLVDTARIIAAGDLSSRLGIRSRDEFELLGGTFDRMTDNLQGIIEKIRGVFSGVEKVSNDVAAVSITVAESAKGQAANIDNTSSSIEELNATIKSIVSSVENLFKSAEESTSSIIEMSASIDMVAGNADEVSSSVEQMSSSIEELNMSTQQIAEKSEALLNKAEESAAALTQMDASIKEVEKSATEAKTLSIQVSTSVSDEGREAVKKATVGMGHIREVVSEVARTIETLGGKAADIDKILDVIRDVAEQTNLLALNAAIISAQAGEHGRGFAVVAGEIRELAERTSLSVEEINTTIKGIQEEATNAVTVVQKGAGSVEEGERLVADVGKTLKKAAVDSENSSNAAQMIAKATAEQAEGVRQVSASSSVMTQMSSEIARATREQTLGSEQIRMAVEVIREKAMQVRTAMSEQSRGVKQISKSSEYATGMAKNILDASREEAKSSELILKSTEEIRGATTTNLSAVDSLKDMVTTLSEQAALLKEELETFKTS